MSSVVCFRHPRYNGIDAPNLSCQTCCSIYIDNVIERRKEGRLRQEMDYYDWLHEKASEESTNRDNIQNRPPKYFFPEHI